MKTLILAVALLLAASAQAVNTSYNSFTNTGQFTNDGTNIWIPPSVKLTNVVLAGTATGNGSGLTNLTIPTNATYVITNDARPLSLTNTNNLFSGNGGGLTNVPAASLSRTNITGTWQFTNISGVDTLFDLIPLANRTNSGDYNLSVCSPTPRGSTCGGFFFGVWGTNATIPGYTGIPMGVLPSGATNYLYDIKALQIGGVGLQAIDINWGTVGMFVDPSWPFAIGGFTGNGETDWLFQDPTNWTLHFPTQVSSGNNIDPRVTGLGVNDTLTLDQRSSACRVTVSNLVITAGQFFVKSNQAVTTTAGKTDPANFDQTGSWSTTGNIYTSGSGAIGANNSLLQNAGTVNAPLLNIGYSGFFTRNFIPVWTDGYTGAGFIAFQPPTSAQGSHDPTGAALIITNGATLGVGVTGQALAAGNVLQVDALGSARALTVGTNGVVSASKGYATYNTNQYIIAATGWTNTNAFNCVAYVTPTSASYTYSDGTNTIMTGAAITATTPITFVMHPSYKITAAAGLAGVAIAQ